MTTQQEVTTPSAPISQYIDLPFSGEMDEIHAKRDKDQQENQEE